MIKKLVRGIRKHERLFVFILLIFVALAFGITGVMLDVFSKKERSNVLGKIFDREIVQQDFWDIKIRWKALANLYIRQFRYLPAYFPFNMAEHEELVFWQEDRLVNAISTDDAYYDNLARAILVLRALAERVGIKVTSNEIRTQIEKYPILKPQQGGFNVENYRMMLRTVRISESAFEKTVKEFLQIFAYASLVTESIVPTYEEVYQAYLHNNEEMKIRCLVFKPDDFQDKIRVKSPEEIEYFFQNNIDNYRIPEKVQIEYILADYDLLKKVIREPTLEEMKDYYEKYKESFKMSGPGIPDDASVAIYKSFDKVKEEVKSLWQAGEAEVLAADNIIKADEKIKQLLLRDKPVDLSAIAREFSFKYDITGLFSQDYILEIAKETGSSEQFTRQVFAYPEKEVSPYLSTTKGFIIFRVLKKKPPRTPEFTRDLKEKIIKDLKEVKSKELARQQADDLAQEILNKVSEEFETMEPRLGETDSEKGKLTKEIRDKWFKKLAVEKDLEPVETRYFKRTDPIPELFENTFQFNEKVFELSEGDFKVISDTIKNGLGKEDDEIYYLTQVTAHRLPSGDDFETQKSRLEKEVEREKVQEFLKNWQEEIKIQTDNLKPEKVAD